MLRSTQGVQDLSQEKEKSSQQSENAPSMASKTNFLNQKRIFSYEKVEEEKMQDPSKRCCELKGKAPLREESM